MHPKFISGDIGMTNVGIKQCVDDAIERWWNTLLNRVIQIRNSGYVPVLVALSRKMPRLIEWVIQSYIPKHPELRPADVLNDCEITTELSIPFRYATKDSNIKECYILLDDIIIHGTTLRNVARNIELLMRCSGNGQEVCFISSIFLYQRPVQMPQCVSLADIEMLDTHDIDTVKSIIAELALRVREANLPLDMEYPILRITDENNCIKDAVCSYFDHLILPNTYTYKGTWNTRTIVFKRNEYKYLADFAKVRFFSSNQSASFEIFAPYTLPDFLMRGNNIQLFDTIEYSSLWQKVAYPLLNFVESNSNIFNQINGDLLHQDISRSLIVWANYLLSLAYLTANGIKAIPNEFRTRLRVYEKDIILILGAKYANAITSDINKIISNNVREEPSVGLELGGIDSFAPKFFELEYSLLKAQLASKSKFVENVMMGIFKFQNFANPIYDSPQFKYERLFYGETYASLIKSCSPYFRGESIEHDINKWIDDNIDNGSVVPKYEFFLTKEGNRMWRRFFHAGLNNVVSDKPNEQV